MAEQRSSLRSIFVREIRIGAEHAWGFVVGVALLLYAEYVAIRWLMSQH
jgi:hypothetical protein